MQARKLVVIGCARSAGVAMDQLTAGGWALPEGVEWVQMPCANAIDELHMMRAFESGAEQVLVLSCYQGACRSLEGGERLEKRVQAIKQTLTEIGMSPELLTHRRLAPNMASDLRIWIESACKPQTYPATEQDAGEA